MVQLVSVNHSISGDEIDITAKIRNDGTKTSEYRMFVVGPSGSTLERTPNVTWKNLAPGQEWTATLTSRWDGAWDLNSVLPFYTLRVSSQNGLEIAEATKRIETVRTVLNDAPAAPIGSPTGMGIYQWTTPYSGAPTPTVDVVRIPSEPSASGGGFFDSVKSAGAGAGFVLLAIIVLVAIVLLKKK